eukprot:TRINITY_DN9991_c0_g1_i2.p1 TRINITY_DN9991_c0_g1~~TRINITY_DN9991_c0_g1_i2.p1  ORF type:complete len:1172 (-),score=139.32 TRINITY_DN9991_c0_g1_i2:3-3518(-)
MLCDTGPCDKQVVENEDCELLEWMQHLGEGGSLECSSEEELDATAAATLLQQISQGYEGSVNLQVNPGSPELRHCTPSPPVESPPRAITLQPQLSRRGTPLASRLVLTASSRSSDTPSSRPKMPHFPCPVDRDRSFVFHKDPPTPLPADALLPTHLVDPLQGQSVLDPKPGDHESEFDQPDDEVDLSYSAGGWFTPAARPPSRSRVVASHGGNSQFSPYEFGFCLPNGASNQKQPCEKKTKPLLTPVRTPAVGLITQITTTTPKGTRDRKQYVQPDHKRKLEKIDSQRRREVRMNRLKVLCVDIVCSSREQLRPDPQFDPVQAVFCTLHYTDSLADETWDDHTLLVVAQTPQKFAPLPSRTRVREFSDEKELLQGVIDIFRALDPDIVCGWELQSTSLGFLIQRGTIVLSVNMNLALSRVPLMPQPRKSATTELPRGLTSMHEPLQQGDEWGWAKQSGIHLPGRVVLNLWRIFRSEVKLSSYTLCAVSYHLLGRRVPDIPPHVVTAAFASSTPQQRMLAVTHLVQRATFPLRLANHLDIFNRTAEMAAIYGIQFFDVLSRGSQYRVESMMIRLAKPMNYVMISPTREQVRNQNAQEAIPLVMEPQSGYYRHPVIVLDFRSLYPSCIIAYNMCFSTCIGRATPTRRKKIGAIDNYTLPKGWLQENLENIYVAPNSVMFVRECVRQGVLPKLLSEILDTRFFVQSAMKLADKNGDRVTKRINDARQLALKLIANVTFGYTAASATGRMPCSDIADAIVLYARDALERAMRLIAENEEWQATVVYGDTDSMFVHVPNATLARAFEVGKQIAAQVTATNPSPIRLKLEKVFLPCFLVTKKRYVGYAYEQPDQEKPVFDAKGIECIRRDQCPATRAVMEKMLRILFDTDDLSLVKQYFQKQMGKIQRGDVAVSDMIFQKEVRLGTYSTDRAPPPAAIIGIQNMRNDRRAEPLYGERVPYVVVNDHTTKVKDMLQHPLALLHYRGPSPPLINASYYITRQIIPALHRLFQFTGANVTQWYRDMPRTRKRSRFFLAQLHATSNSGVRDAGVWSGKRRTIDSYYQQRDCCLCEEHPAVLEPPAPPVCENCLAAPAASLCRLVEKIKFVEREQQALWDTCCGCAGTACPQLTDACEALDCPLPFQKKSTAQSLAQMRVVWEFLKIRFGEDAPQGSAISLD